MDGMTAELGTDDFNTGVNAAAIAAASAARSAPAFRLATVWR